MYLYRSIKNITGNLILYHIHLSLRSPPLSALASLGLVASPWVAPTLKGRLRTSA